MSVCQGAPCTSCGKQSNSPRPQVLTIYSNMKKNVPGVLLRGFHVLVIARLFFSKDILRVWFPNEKEQNCPHEAYHRQGNEHRPPVIL